MGRLNEKRCKIETKSSNFYLVIHKYIFIHILFLYSNTSKQEITRMTSTIQNKGTGAGGANTNLNGISFEKKTDNEPRLLSTGFVRKPIPGSKAKYAYYLEHEIGPDESITYLTQSGLRLYFAHFFNNKDICRKPDEAYLFRNGDKYTLKILEKKNQNTDGSVDTKLLAGKGFIDEYEIILGPNFTVKYAFCLSEFLKKDYISDCKKSQALRRINEKYGIAVLYGDDENYFDTLDEWIAST